jgi:hypothetical protein
MDGEDLANPVKYLGGEEFFTVGGLTKRELIAAMAMQGLLSCPSYIQTVEVLASTSTRAADALIERLNADPAEGVTDGK